MVLDVQTDALVLSRGQFRVEYRQRGIDFVGLGGEAQREGGESSVDLVGLGGEACRWLPIQLVSC